MEPAMARLGVAADGLRQLRLQLALLVVGVAHHPPGRVPPETGGESMKNEETNGEIHMGNPCAEWVKWNITLQVFGEI